MKLLKTTGEKIVFYMELGPNIFYYQVENQGFVARINHALTELKEIWSFKLHDVNVAENSLFFFQNLHLTFTYMSF